MKFTSEKSMKFTSEKSMKNYGANPQILISFSFICLKGIIGH